MSNLTDTFLTKKNNFYKFRTNQNTNYNQILSQILMSTQQIIQELSTLSVQDLRQVQETAQYFLTLKPNEENLPEMEYPEVKISEWEKINPKKGKLFTNLEDAKLWLNS